jgi:type IV pilus assembly protein PilP
MKRLLLISLLLSVYGCNGSDEELKQWMADARKDVHPITPHLAEPKTFEPFIYAEQSQVDPFDPAKITNALRKLAAKSNNGLAPDLSRRREPLESFPLDSIQMVGTLSRPNLRYALLRADGVVYQVKMGNYVGQNFGIVTVIGDNQVTLKEVVQDASGEWVERISKLDLQESTK